MEVERKFQGTGMYAGTGRWEGILRSWWRNNLDWGYQREDLGQAANYMMAGNKDKVFMYLRLGTQTWC